MRRVRAAFSNRRLCQTTVPACPPPRERPIWRSQRNGYGSRTRLALAHIWRVMYSAIFEIWRELFTKHFRPPRPIQILDVLLSYWRACRRGASPIKCLVLRVEQITTNVPTLYVSVVALPLQASSPHRRQPPASSKPVVEGIQGPAFRA